MIIPEELKREWEIIKQGTDEIIPEDELIAKLENSHKKKVPLRVKLGIDPSSPDIHLGHTIPIRKLEQFQKIRSPSCFNHRWIYSKNW